MSLLSAVAASPGSLNDGLKNKFVGFYFDDQSEDQCEIKEDTEDFGNRQNAVLNMPRVASHCAVVAADMSPTSQCSSLGDPIVNMRSDTSIMKDVARAMSHIHSSNASSGAKQLLTAGDGQVEDRRGFVISCHGIGMFIVVAIVILVFLSQHLPNEVHAAHHRAEANGLLERARHKAQMCTSDKSAKFDACYIVFHDVLADIEVFNLFVDERFAAAQSMSLAVSISFAAIIGCLTISASILVSRQLNQLGNLSQLMSRLGNLDLMQNGVDSSPIPMARRSRIREVRELQDAFCHLAIGVDRFAKFVPESVVRRIVSGESRAARLHVDRRLVTIMFTDIADFTAITEQMSRRNPRDLLLVLTRYFTVMTHIMEAYEGSVGEILGDGILTFWNTPNPVARQETKACRAAVAMHQALKFLNAEFDMLSLPCLQIRVGIHTGQVLTGNIGSFTKMKFGCMGDPVNLASRLESLCKVYGVGVICSSATHDKLHEDDGFVCRRLDYVQVKGKGKPTKIFEVLGCDGDASDASTCPDAGKTVTSLPMRPIQEVISEAIGKLDTDWESALNLVAATRWSQSSNTTDAVSNDAVSSQACLCRFDSEVFSAPGSPLPPTDNLQGISPSRRQRALLYEDALGAFQSGRFEESRSLSEEILRQAPEDVPASKLLERSEFFISDGLSASNLASWNGVAVMTEK